MDSKAVMAVAVLALVSTGCASIYDPLRSRGTAAQVGETCGADTAKSYEDQGIYAFRPIRGLDARLSLHAFGATIDLNAETNALGTDGDMSPDVVEVFRHFGFRWGGEFAGRKDPMHFQYATGY